MICFQKVTIYGLLLTYFVKILYLYIKSEVDKLRPVGQLQFAKNKSAARENFFFEWKMALKKKTLGADVL